MITISTDNSEIFQLLENSNSLFEDFSADKVVFFDSKDDCYLVFYVSVTRNFISFKAENYFQETNALPSLLDSVQNFAGSPISSSNINYAIKLIENKMHTKNNNRFYFDAH